MEQQVTTVPTGHRKNALGHLVPEELIAPVDKIRDDLVNSIIAKGKALREAIAEFKAAKQAEIAAMKDYKNAVRALLVAVKTAAETKEGQ